MWTSGIYTFEPSALSEGLYYPKPRVRSGVSYQTQALQYGARQPNQRLNYNTFPTPAPSYPLTQSFHKLIEAPSYLYMCMLQKFYDVIFCSVPSDTSVPFFKMFIDLFQRHSYRARGRDGDFITSLLSCRSEQ